MKVVENLLNRSEERVFNELSDIARNNGLRVFSKVRLSDVIQKGSTRLTQREFNYLTRAHCDFVLTDERSKPIAIIEYDGPYHADPIQQERDAIKNELCRNATMGLLRINDRHVTKYRGMTVLRWIVEVSELQKGFAEAQESGQIPWDEPFDPCFIDGLGGGGRFPYWLSAPATQSFHSYFKKFDKATRKGWGSLTGEDTNETHYRMSYLFFDNKIVYTKTSIRKQDFDFPHFELLDEISTCDLGIKLTKFTSGFERALSKAEFEPIFKSFAQKYNAHPSHSMGSSPIPYTWDFKGCLKFVE